MSDPKMKSLGKQISQFVSKLPNEIMKLNDNDKRRYLIDFQENEYLNKSIEYLKEIFSSDIKIYNSDDKDVYDPASKIRFAIPLRPAIYIE